MKYFLFLILILITLEAKDLDRENIYFGLDTTINVNGHKSFGSSTDDLDKAFNYKVDYGAQIKLGYKLNHIVRMEYGYSKFYSDEYKNFDIHSLAAILSSKFVSTRHIFNTPFNIYPSYEIGITHDVFNVGASIHYEYNKNYEFLLSYRSLLKGLNFGGGNNSVEGYYLGIRFKL